MTEPIKFFEALRKEAERIEEDSIHSAKGHFNSASTWKRRHYLLGIPATILGALAGAAIIKNYQEVAGVLSLSATILTALVTFLKPTDTATSHKKVADQYLALRNDARIFREVEMLEDSDIQTLSDKLKSLAARRNELNQNSPEIPRKAFETARLGIKDGENQYNTDKEN